MACGLITDQAEKIPVVTPHIHPFIIVIIFSPPVQFAQETRVHLFLSV